MHSYSIILFYFSSWPGELPDEGGWSGKNKTKTGSRQSNDSSAFLQVCFWIYVCFPQQLMLFLFCNYYHASLNLHLLLPLILSPVVARSITVALLL